MLPKKLANPTLVRLTLGFAMLALAIAAQPPDVAEGWLAEFHHSSTQLTALADATPAEKFSWRPGPGVRSISEVYMHIAIGNFWLLSQARVKAPGAPPISQDTEKKITAKADVMKLLKQSFEAVQNSYPKTDLKKTVNFLGKETTADGVFLRILVHNHEHMGQSIAYARMNNIVPPWSKKTGE